MSNASPCSTRIFRSVRKVHLLLEIKDALYGSDIPVKDYVIGLGGRDVRKKDIKAIVALVEKGQGDLFYGLRKEVL